MEVLQSVEEVIAAVGGNAAAQSLAGVGASAVSNWKARGTIPSELCLIFSRALANENKQADPAVFGLRERARA